MLLIGQILITLSLRPFFPFQVLCEGETHKNELLRLHIISHFNKILIFQMLLEYDDRSLTILYGLIVLCRKQFWITFQNTKHSNAFETRNQTSHYLRHGFRYITFFFDLMNIGVDNVFYSCVLQLNSWHFSPSYHLSCIFFYLKSNQISIISMIYEYWLYLIVFDKFKYLVCHILFSHNYKCNNRNRLRSSSKYYCYHQCKTIDTIVTRLYH